MVENRTDAWKFFDTELVKEHDKLVKDYENQLKGLREAHEAKLEAYHSKRENSVQLHGQFNKESKLHLAKIQILCDEGDKAHLLLNFLQKEFEYIEVTGDKSKKPSKKSLAPVIVNHSTSGKGHKFEILARDIPSLDELFKFLEKQEIDVLEKHFNEVDGEVKVMSPEKITMQLTAMCTPYGELPKDKWVNRYWFKPTEKTLWVRMPDYLTTKFYCENNGSHIELIKKFVNEHYECSFHKHPLGDYVGLKGKDANGVISEGGVTFKNYSNTLESVRAYVDFIYNEEFDVIYSRFKGNELESYRLEKAELLAEIERRHQKDLIAKGISR